MFEILNMLEFTNSIVINAVIKLLSFIMVTFVIEIVITRIFKRLTRKTETSFDDRVLDIIHKPALLGLLTLGIYFAIEDLQPTAKFMESTNRVFYSIAITILTVVMFRMTTLIVTKILVKVFHVTGVRNDLVPAIASLLKIAIIVLFLIFLLAIWGVDLAPMLASASIISAVVLLAAKDTFSNFFAGISIIVDKPYKIGDYVDLTTERGEVTEIGLRSTRIKTRDDILISIPNSIIANDKIINESAPIENFRVRIPIGVSYNSDIDLVEKILLEIAQSNENVLPEPEPRVRFRSFGESSLNYELLCWAKEPSIRGLTIHDINREIFKRFKKSGIEIPYPQRDLHIRSTGE